MTRVDYISIATNGEEYAEDEAWIQQYGYVQVIEELSEYERLRPMWERLISSLERGDKLVVSRFSDTLRGTHELAIFIEYCRVKMARTISTQNRIGTSDEFSFDTRPPRVIRTFGSLSKECAMLCKASVHTIHLQQNIRPPKRLERVLLRLEREKNIVSMYNEGHSIDDIFAISGLTSRSPVFCILNEHGMTLGRGPRSRLLKERNKEQIKNRHNE